jgi:predicted nucleotidyltransferase
VSAPSFEHVQTKVMTEKINLSPFLDGVTPDPVEHDIDPETEKAVRRFLALISERYDMAGAIVFGSRARGTHRPDSDADVAVLLRGEHLRFLTTKLAMADVAFDVLLETGIAISPLPVWLDEWEHPETYLNPTLLRNIAREGIRL